jgi:hypothetical protein
MQQVLSALNGFAVEATDGQIGTVKDFLVDDQTWKLRWLVVHTGGWLHSERVLLHPSVIGIADFQRQLLPVSLTKQRVAHSPAIASDLPVSRQFQSNLYDYYGWDPFWGGASYFGANVYEGGGLVAPYGDGPHPGTAADRDLQAAGSENAADLHLRSIAEMTGYHVQASDGPIGHIEGFIADDTTWTIRYIIVATRNWWPGQHVLLSPFAIREVNWAGREVWLHVSQSNVKSSPPWEPLAAVDEAYQRSLHNHYQWPGYGW